jgi:hypothetical protein
MNASSSFHLIMESNASTTTGNPDAAGIHPCALLLPDGVSCLQLNGHKAPEIHPGGKGSTAGLILEPVLTRDGTPRLAIINPSSRHLSINGLRAPEFYLLSEKDQFQFDDSCAFHVTIFFCSRIVSPTADMTDKPCPICLSPLNADQQDTIYACQCNTYFHLSGPSGLECARAINACPHCGRSIRLQPQPGYNWLPDLCDE